MAGTLSAHSQTGTKGLVAEVRRTIRAPRQRVFEAWTQPEHIKAWHSNGPNKVASVDVDLRVGGKHSIHMLEPEGFDHHSFGVYTEIDPPKKLAYTWNWAHLPDMPETLVTVEFLERGDATEVVLRHSGFVTEQAQADHTGGWTSALEKLSTLMEKQH